MSGTRTLRVGEDGSHRYADDEGNLWNTATGGVMLHKNTSAPTPASAGAPPAAGSGRTYTKGSARPTQAESGAAFGEHMRAWRVANPDTETTKFSPRGAVVKAKLKEKLE